MKRSWLVLMMIAGCAQLAPQAPAGLGGTSWQLVKFQGGDDRVLTPDDRSKYTLAFNADGSLNARIDCNRGRGTWKSPEKGRLFLSLMADGGIYELEPGP